MSFAEIKERYLRPYYLQATFVLGSLTLGLRAGAMNFSFPDDVRPPGGGGARGGGH
jgi:hypothetical protein